MIEDIVYKLCKLERKVKILENHYFNCGITQLGSMASGETETVGISQYCPKGNSALLIIAPSELKISVTGRDVCSSGRGIIAVPLKRGQNSFDVSVTASESFLDNALITKMIELG